MANYIVESTFCHKGLKCVVVLVTMGHRNGYVGVPRPHPLYGKGYDEVDVCVHGGLSFNSDPATKNIYPIETDEDLWWFGFDCAHYDDMADWNAVMTEMPEYAFDARIRKALGIINPDSTIKTQQYVEEECKHLAEQLSDSERISLTTEAS